MYFYTGPWGGTARVIPTKIGALNVVIFIEGAQTEEVKKIRRRIEQIIQEEKEKFINTVSNTVL